MINLFKRIEPTSISIFRVLFGLTMVWEMIYFIRIDFVKVFLVNPQLNFHYGNLSFIKPLPEPLLQLLIFALLFSAILITLGKWYKVAITTFFIGFTYIFLLDKSYYNNHLYLICLLSFILIFIKADNQFSLRKKKEGDENTLPAWNLYLIRAQLLVVYFFGGVAKLTSDWLVRKQPTIEILKQKAIDSDLAAALQSDFMINLITYGGLVFDLSVAPLLLFKKTRKIALIAALVFNITNAWLFNDINIFPYLMMFALLLFLNPSYVAKLFSKPKIDRNKDISFQNNSSNNKKVKMAFIGYLTIQCFLPLRSISFSENVDWTEEGQRFSWRMKTKHKELKKVEFKILDYSTKTIIPVNKESFGLCSDQMRLLANSPSSAIQFAEYVREWAVKKHGLKNIEVHADIQVGMNGRKAQAVFKEVDLSTVKKKGVKIDDYLQPLKDN